MFQIGGCIVVERLKNAANPTAAFGEFESNKEAQEWIDRICREQDVKGSEFIILPLWPEGQGAERKE